MDVNRDLKTDGRKETIQSKQRKMIAGKNAHKWMGQACGPREEETSDMIACAEVCDGVRSPLPKCFRIEYPFGQTIQR
jgi:hypothetical protein